MSLMIDQIKVGSFLAGKTHWSQRNSRFRLLLPSGTPGLQINIDECGAEIVDLAVADAFQASLSVRHESTAARAKRLSLVADVLEQHSEEISALICSDVGKPIRVARGEVNRGIQFTRACAAAITQMEDSVLQLDATPAGEGRFGFVKRMPFGVVGAITPFNAPINLLMQKLAPALAAGNAVVVKPALPGTRVAIRLAQALVEAGFPVGLFNVVTGEHEAALQLAAHNDVDVVTYTGGVEGGIALSKKVGIRKFTSELGSNSANIVLADADLQVAAKKIAAAAFEASGQQCVSAQRIIVEREAYSSFLKYFGEATQSLRVGPADDEETDVGPMVSSRAADRIQSLYEDAIQSGGLAVVPFRREGNLVHPTIVSNVPLTASIWQEEAFGPIGVVVAADDVEHALELANDSPFGLQGSIFTNNLHSAFEAADKFDVGSLWVNEASRFRLDMYPFGGMKQSGVGREGVRYAINELSQLKFIGINPQQGAVNA